MRNTMLANSTLNNFWFYVSGNVSVAVPFQPVALPTLKSLAALQALTTSTECSISSTVTKNIEQTTETVIATIMINETITLYGDASTPLPVIISPLPACSTSYLPFGPGKNPDKGGLGITTSTLLVTKKSPVVIRSPSTVGPIYNIPTTTAQAVPAQPAADSSQGGVPHDQQPASGSQGSEGSNNEGPSKSGENVGGMSSGGDISPGSAPLKQVSPEQMPSGSSGSGQSTSPQSEAGTGSGQIPGNNVQQPGAGQSSEHGGQAVGVGQSSGNGSPASSGGEASDYGIQSSSGGQGASGEHFPSGGGNSNGQQSSGQQQANGGQAPSEGTIPSIEQNPSGEQTGSNGVHASNSEQPPYSGEPPSNGGQTPNNNGQTRGGGQTVGNGGSSNPTSGQSASGSEGNSASSDQMAGQESSGSEGDTPGSQSSFSETDSSGDDDGNSKNAGSVAAGGYPADSDSSPIGVAGGSVLYPNQQPPNPVTIDNVPVSIGGAAVVIGSQTVSIGSPATTIIANGEPIAVEPSQIVAPGTTVPIVPTVTPPPAVSTMIGTVPLVLQPSDIIIGSQKFSHGSSAAFAVYNGQTYSWDAKQLIGPGGTMVNFPSNSPSAPRITAGGQVFSVYSSTLKVSGTDIAIPNTPKASPFVYKGQQFLVNPSQLVAPDRSITIPPVIKATPFVYDEQTFSVDSSNFIAPSATIPLSSGTGTVRYGTQVFTVEQTQIICPTGTITLSNAAPVDLAATPSAITTGGLTFSLGPQAAVIGSSTYSFLPGQTPATVTDLGQAVTLDSSGVHFGTVNIPVPTNPPSYLAVTQRDLTFSVAPSAVVFGGQTDSILPSMTPIYTVVSGQTISIGTQGVGLASTTIPLPMPTPDYATVTEGDLTLSVAPSEAVFKGSTFAIGPSMPTTMVLDGQTVRVGPSTIYFPGTTVDLPTATNQEAPAAVTADGLTFSVGPTNAIIGGTTYAIGSGAMSKTVVLGSETISLGTNGVVLPSTTIAPEQTPSAITADGLTFSADATEAIINGTAYAIGSEAIAKTIVVGSETIGLGTKGIVLPFTTIAPWGNATQNSLSSMYGTAAATGISPSAASATGPSPPTGLPGTEPEGTKNDVHRGSARHLRAPGILLVTMVLGVLLMSLLSYSA